MLCLNEFREYGKILKYGEYGEMFQYCEIINKKETEVFKDFPILFYNEGPIHDKALNP